MNPDTVADQIGALSVPGLNIRKPNAVPQALTERDCPLVFPVPEKFVVLEEARQITHGERALWQYTYVLTYRYVHAPVGKDRSVSKILPGKAAGYKQFVRAVARVARTLGAGYVAPANTPEWGVIDDPSGQKFEAADIALRVTEFSAD